MSALAWLTAISLAAPVVTPVSTSPPRDVIDEAFEFYDRGAFLEAAAVAIDGYVAPARPPAERLELAQLAQESFSRAYEASTASTPRPEYLCRALDVLDATAPLAIAAKDRETHEKLRETHQSKLTNRHPDVTCEVGTELRPILVTSKPRSPEPVPAAPATSPTAVHPPGSIDSSHNPGPRAPTALKTAGAVALTLGLVGFAAMAGGLVLRSRAQKAAGPLDATYKQQGGFRPDQSREWNALVATGTAGQRLAVAGGVCGAVLLVAGAALVARGHVLTSRPRVSVMAGPDRAGLLVEGRF